MQSGKGTIPPQNKSDMSKSNLIVAQTSDFKNKKTIDVTICVMERSDSTEWGRGKHMVKTTDDLQVSRVFTKGTPKPRKIHEYTQCCKNDQDSYIRDPKCGKGQVELKSEKVFWVYCGP